MNRRRVSVLQINTNYKLIYLSLVIFPKYNFLQIGNIIIINFDINS